MSDSSSGGSLVSSSFDARVGYQAGGGDVEERVDLFLAGEPDRAAAHQVESAALELIGSAHGVDLPQQNQGRVRGLGDVDIPADGDVQVPH